MTAVLRLHQSDQVALVDAEDLPELARWRWFILNGYVVRQQYAGKDRTCLIYLHRYLVQARPSEVVDHEDRDRLNNQRGNLRRCSQSENMANRAAPMPHGYRGVYPEKRGGNWRAQIKVANRSRRLGTFPTPRAAALAYDAAAREAFGRFARLNFPELAPVAEPLPLPLDEAEAWPAPPAVAGVDFFERSVLEGWRTSRPAAPATLVDGDMAFGMPW